MYIHNIHITSALTRSPNLEGSASSHRPRGATRGQEGDAPSDPPTHPLATHTGYRSGTAPKPAVVLLTSTSTQYNHRTASLPEVLPQKIISAAAPVVGGRVANQWAAAAHPPSDPRGPDSPEGRALTAPAPRAALPAQSRSTHGASIQKARSVS